MCALRAHDAAAITPIVHQRDLSPTSNRRRSGRLQAL